MRCSSQYVRDITQRNLATLSSIEFRIAVKNYLDASGNLRKDVSDVFMDLVDTWKGRDKYIQNIM